jgi:hypothetical protein
MNQEDKKNILTYGRPSGTIEVRVKPDEILEVEPEILAIMNARLRGESFDRVYGREDQVSKELLIQNERTKLKRIFGSHSQLNQAFTSLKAIKNVRKELTFENVNRELLAQYLKKQSSGDPVDEVDGYGFLIFGEPLRSKQDRLLGFSSSEAEFTQELKQVFGLLQRNYRETHFDVIGVSKELLQLQKPLRDLLYGGKLLPAVDEILQKFYGVVA